MTRAPMHGSTKLPCAAPRTHAEVSSTTQRLSDSSRAHRSFHKIEAITQKVAAMCSECLMAGSPPSLHSACARIAVYSVRMWTIMVREHGDR